MLCYIYSYDALTPGREMFTAQYYSCEKLLYPVPYPVPIRCVCTPYNAKRAFCMHPTLSTKLWIIPAMAFSLVMFIPPMFTSNQVETYTVYCTILVSTRFFCYLQCYISQIGWYRAQTLLEVCSILANLLALLTLAQVEPAGLIKCLTKRPFA